MIRYSRAVFGMYIRYPSLSSELLTIIIIARHLAPLHSGTLMSEAASNYETVYSRLLVNGSLYF